MSACEYIMNEEQYFNKCLGCWTGKVIGGTFGMPFEGKDPKLIQEILPNGFTGWLGDFFSLGVGLGKGHQKCVNDDEQFELIAILLCEELGIENFTTENLSKFWMKNLNKNNIFTAERVAYEKWEDGISINEANQPTQNVYYDFIGGQMKGELYGMWAPGNPEYASKLARIDGAVAHSGVGIAGEEWIARLISNAMITDNQPPTQLELIQNITNSLNAIPDKLSRQPTNEFKDSGYKALEICRNNPDPRGWRDGFSVLMEYIESEWLVRYKNSLNDVPEDVGGFRNSRNDREFSWWVHTIPNEMIIILSLFYGAGDFGTSITLASLMGMDTDCNAGNIGALIGTYLGYKQIPAYWQQINQGKIETFVKDWKSSTINDLAQRTVKIGKLWQNSLK